MKRNTNRLLNLINNIIDTSKIENGKYKITKSKEDIVYIVEGVHRPFSLYYILDCVEDGAPLSP